MNENRGIWKAKRLDNEEWVWGYYVKCLPDNGEFIHYIIEMNAHCNIVDYKTLGECSCVPDTNGDLIFEGDICTVATPNIADDEYGVVKYDENEAVFVIDFGTYTINFCDNINGSAVEVIGNIHDNPELIQKGAADNG